MRAQKVARNADFQGKYKLKVPELVKDAEEIAMSKFKVQCCSTGFNNKDFK